MNMTDDEEDDDDNDDHDLLLWIFWPTNGGETFC